MSAKFGRFNAIQKRNDVFLKPITIHHLLGEGKDLTFKTYAMIAWKANIFPLTSTTFLFGGGFQSCDLAKKCMDGEVAWHFKQRNINDTCRRSWPTNHRPTVPVRTSSGVQPQFGSNNNNDGLPRRSRNCVHRKQSCLRLLFGSIILILVVNVNNMWLMTEKKR